MSLMTSEIPNINKQTTIKYKYPYYALEAKMKKTYHSVAFNEGPQIYQYPNLLNNKLLQQLSHLKSLAKLRAANVKAAPYQVQSHNECNI